MTHTITPSTQEFRNTIRSARQVGTPLLALRTADPASAISHVQASLNGKSAETPLLQYDFGGGLKGLNDKGKAEAKNILGNADPTLPPPEILNRAQNMGEDSILFFHNPQRIWENPDVSQGIWNLRDTFKTNGRMLVLITTAGATLPAELSNDVIVLDEPLPSAEDLKELIKETFDAAELKQPDAATAEKAVDAMIGLASFPAEQVLSMSLSKSGVDLPRLWARKAQAVEQTPGLSVWRGGEKFDAIGGCENVKNFMRAVIKGKEAPHCTVFLDEIEKSVAGTGTDTSGVTTEMVGTLLSWMQDHNANGCIFIGAPGAAKSAIAKAVGAEADVPTIAFDFGAMKSGIVGSSGERLRAALNVVDAVSSGRALFIATCNSIANLPPELRRRFTFGTFYFPLPDAGERKLIWNIYFEKYAIAKERRVLPDDEGWTGAEIKQCCYISYNLGLSLREAAAYIVPICKSASQQIERLQREASGKFISASRPGVYAIEEKVEEVAAPAKRKFNTN